MALKNIQLEVIVKNHYMNMPLMVLVRTYNYKDSTTGPQLRTYKLKVTTPKVRQLGTSSHI